MKALHSYTLAAVLFLCGTLIGCSKRVEKAEGWATPNKVTETQEGLGWITPYRWRDTLIALAPMRSGPPRCFLFKPDQRSWSEILLPGFPSDIVAFPGIDEADGRIMLQQGYTESERLFLNLFIVRLAVSGTIQVEAKRTWSIDEQSLFGDMAPNVRFSEPGKRQGVRFPGCLVNGSDIHIVYCLGALTYFGINGVKDGPFNNGVFYSSDLGKTWQMQSISQTQIINASLCRTKGQYYYFGVSLGDGKGHDLWFSQNSVGANSWTQPMVVTKSLARAYNRFVAKTSDDTVHLCWMDCRHEKWDFNLQGPRRENYEIVYCCRKDRESRWSKEVILSKGLSYAYAPSLSVEGQSVVVAWAGIEVANRAHSASDVNDIYYITSKDGGKTWSRMLKVTDKAKDGLTSGEPQVVLQNGVIHLLYTQGQLNLQQISTGLRKLNQPPWPIYYTQRPFPK